MSVAPLKCNFDCVPDHIGLTMVESVKGPNDCGSCIPYLGLPSSQADCWNLVSRVEGEGLPTELLDEHATI